MSQDHGEYVISVNDLQRELEGLPWESEGPPPIGDLMYLCEHLRASWVKQCKDLVQIQEAMHSPANTDRMSHSANYKSAVGTDAMTPLELLEEERAATLASLAGQYEATKLAQTEYFDKKKALLTGEAQQPAPAATFEVEVAVDTAPPPGVEFRQTEEEGGA